MTPVTTRFAPSPTGDLHLGHAYSAFFAAEQAEKAGGRFLLRVEDIDITRCKPELEARNLEDLHWLGLTWPEPVRRQSEHFEEYRAALEQLQEMGLVYRCYLSRRELNDALSAPHGAPETAPTDTERFLSEDERARRAERGDPFALRLRMAEARRIAGPLDWHDRNRGTQTARPEIFGDAVLARRDIPTSYHLSVVLDDAVQQISLVTRGEDLFDSTHLHRLLQALLGLPTPDYHHHDLLRDTEGKRLAKRFRSASLREMQAAGRTAGEVRGMAFTALRSSGVSNK